MKTAIVAVSIMTAILFGFGQGQSMEQTVEHPVAANTRTAVFAGGCFWCTESDFEKLPGVIEAVSGYTGGHVVDPSYEQVSAGGTGHVEAVKVLYDPAKLTYGQLLDWFWRHVDPTDAGGQFVDGGAQYRSVIFYADEEQRGQAEASKAKLAASGRFDKPIVTEIVPLGPFYPAEEYHQNYYKKNPIRYHWYRYNSGRDQFLEKVWGKDMVDRLPPPEEQIKPAMAAEAGGAAAVGLASERRYTIPDDAQLRRTLTPLQYRVTREGATEPPFANAYWNNHAPGIYVDIISGEPLFSSADKFDSGTGWPSFTRPLTPENVVEVRHGGIFSDTIEVRSKHADSHLGDLFHDGPQPTGLRYCIDSAALRFIPREDLEKEGYGEYLKLFK